MDVAAELRCLGVTGILPTAAELGRITKLKCQMPRCLCPVELGGRKYFESVTRGLSDWMPTHDHRRLKSQGGQRSVENTRLAHRLCNRVDASVALGRSTKRDQARVEAARSSALQESVRRTIGLQREVARLLCGENLAIVRAFVEEVYQWDGVTLEPYFDRGHGPTGLRLLRDGQRFANAFPSRSIQFAHGGVPLVGLGLPSEHNVERYYQSIPVREVEQRLDEARLLASYAYWRVAQ
jgi:hypothetical protein